MEQQQKTQSLLEDTKLYKFFNWQLPTLAQILYTILLQLFFYLWLWRGISLLSILSVYALGKIFSSLVRSSNQDVSEWMSEETSKRIFVLAYTVSNRVVQELRNIVNVKGGIKSISKVMMLMYLSLIVKFLGDKLVLFLVINGLLIYPLIAKRFKREGSEKSEFANKIKQFIKEKVLSKIPKYSDLQQQQRVKQQ